MPAAPTQREFALEVVQRLRGAGYEALWAGGCVRDQLLGREPKDYDVATSALPDAVRELFGRRRTLAIGAAFGVITVLGPRPLAPIEVATFRTDGDYRDGRRPQSVEFTDAQHDAQRRDFTINGLFCDPLADRIIDYVGGVADLEARVVRAIGAPNVRFAEDKLRMLRAVRFAATFDFAVDPGTLAAIREMADQVTAVSGERIGGELRRTLAHANRRRGAELLAASGLLRPLAPELAQIAEANEEAWQAALIRLERLGNADFPTALAALLLGVADGAGAKRIARRWRLSNKESDRTAWLLDAFPAIAQAASLPWPHLQRLLAHEHGGALVDLAAAALSPDDAGVLRCRVALDRPAGEWNPPSLISGDDLIAAGFEAGPQFSSLLDHLRDEQLEGRIATRHDAIAAAKQWLQRHP